MMKYLAVGSIAALSLLSSFSNAALTLVNDWGNGPTQMRMYVQVPSKPVSNPAIIVMLHGCGLSASVHYAMTTEYQQIASQKGHVLIYPETNRDMRCWDVATTQSLSHDGGGDSQTIVNMVQYALKKWNGDRKKVFVSGFSSGGMMTSVLCATYPDVFSGGATFSGVPHACLQGSKGSSPVSDTAPCTKGGYTKSTQQWGDLVRESYPGYSGAYPKIAYWHGTADFIVRYQVFGEALKQWSDIHNVQFTRNVSNTPGRGITKMIYGDGTKLLGYSTQGGGHSFPGQAKETLDFWGI